MKCKHCNAEIPNDSNFCEFCGAKVKKRMPWWGILLIVLVSLSFIMFGALALFNLFEYISNSSNDNGNSGKAIIEEPMEEPIEVVEVEESPAPIEEAPTPVAEERGKAEVVGPAAKGAAVSDSKQEEAVKQVPAGYVDLGLPSGTLWKAKNESGYYDYDQAVSSFGYSLPSRQQRDELFNKCQWVYDGSVYRVFGPNGNEIDFPTYEGYRTCDGYWLYKGERSRYWIRPNGGLYDQGESAQVFFIELYRDSKVWGNGWMFNTRCELSSVRLVQGK